MSTQQVRSRVVDNDLEVLRAQWMELMERSLLIVEHSRRAVEQSRVLTEMAGHQAAPVQYEPDPFRILPTLDAIAQALAELDQADEPVPT